MIVQLLQSIALTAVIFSQDEITDLKVKVYQTTIQEPDGNETAWISEHNDYDVELHWIYFLVPWCTFFHYLIFLVYWCNWEDRWSWWRSTKLVEINENTTALRWGEYAVSASLMTFVIGVLHSVTDINALWGLVATNVATQYLGWLADNKKNNYRRWTFFAGVIVFSLTWIPMLYSFTTTGDAPPWWIRYGFVPGMNLSYSVFPIIMALRLWGVLDPKKVTTIGCCSKTLRVVPTETITTGWWIRSSDHWFDIASFVSKAILDWVIVGGLLGWGSA